MKTEFTRSILLVLGIVMCLPLMSQETVRKTIQESLGNLEGGILDIEHRRGDVRIEHSSGAEASMTLNIEINGKYQDEMEEFLKEIEVSVTGNGKNKKVKVGNEIKSWIQNLGRSRIKFKNGNVYNGIKKLDFELVIAVPDLQKLRISNRYDDIHLASIASDVYIDLYSGDLFAEDLDGKLESKIKYGKAKVGKTASLRLDLYESEIEADDSGPVHIESKYSDLAMASMESLTYVGYEDEVMMKDLADKSRFEAKYCEVELGNVGGDLEIEFYETDLILGSVGQIEGSCKYGKFELSKAAHVHLHSDYEMEIKIGECDQLTLLESKYAQFDIGSIAKKARISAYETTIEVERILDTFDDLWIECKYDRMDFPLPSQLSYNLDAEIKYGELDYNRSGFAKHDSRAEGSTTHVVASNANANVKVFIRSYETDVSLQ